MSRQRRWLCPFCLRWFYSINWNERQQHIGEAHPEHVGLRPYEIVGLGIAVWRGRMEQLVELYGARCLACGQRPDGPGFHSLTLDHVVPLARGGSDDLSNWQLLCRACNRNKGDLTVDYRPVPVPGGRLGA